MLLPCSCNPQCQAQGPRVVVRRLAYTTQQRALMYHVEHLGSKAGALSFGGIPMSLFYLGDTSLQVLDSGARSIGVVSRSPVRTYTSVL